MIAAIENLLFLLLVAVAFLFQFLARTAGKAGKDQPNRTSTPTPRTSTPMPRAPADSDEDRIRKLLEALGQPPTSTPPPPVAPRTDIPPRPLAPVQPTIARPWELIREAQRKREETPKRIPPPRPVRDTAKTVPPKVAGAPEFGVQKAPLPIAPPPIRKASTAVRATAEANEQKTDVATLLASTSGLREAIILREILGPPRGLRIVDSV
jgi:hypothetical protein